MQNYHFYVHKYTTERFENGDSNANIDTNIATRKGLKMQQIKYLHAY